MVDTQQRLNRQHSRLTRSRSVDLNQGSLDCPSRDSSQPGTDIPWQEWASAIRPISMSVKKKEPFAMGDHRSIRLGDMLCIESWSAEIAEDGGIRTQLD